MLTYRLWTLISALKRTEAGEKRWTETTCYVLDTALMISSTKMLAKVTPVVPFCANDATIATGTSLASRHSVRAAPRKDSMEYTPK